MFCFHLYTLDEQKCVHCTLRLCIYSIVLLQDDEINLQCQLVEKLKQQMLDQDEVRGKTKTRSETNCIRNIF